MTFKLVLTAPFQSIDSSFWKAALPRFELPRYWAIGGLACSLFSLFLHIIIQWIRRETNIAMMCLMELVLFNAASLQFCFMRIIKLRNMRVFSTARRRVCNSKSFTIVLPSMSFIFSRCYVSIVFVLIFNTQWFWKFIFSSPTVWYGYTWLHQWNPYWRALLFSSATVSKEQTIFLSQLTTFAK